MIREVLSHLHWSWLPVTSMMLFSSVFIGVLIWINRPKNKIKYREVEQYPFQDGTRQEMQK